MPSNEIEAKGPRGPDGTEASVSPVHSADEKSVDISKKTALDSEILPVERNDESDSDSKDAIIVTGADASRHLLPMRDDHDSALTFRSLLLSSGLACFQAVMYQIYTVSHNGLAIVSII